MKTISWLLSLVSTNSNEENQVAQSHHYSFIAQNIDL